MRKNKSYVHGAVLLLFSGLAVKLLGALFKIPLTNIIGDKGMGLFAFSMQFFSILFVVCAAGIPIAESCLVSEFLALGCESRAKQLVFHVSSVFTLLSAAAAALLFIFAQPLCSFFGEPDAAACVRAIAPAVVLVTAEAGLKGWYQGTGNMQPTSVSQVLEAVGKLFFGLFFAGKALQYNLGYISAAAGAVLGVTLGEGIALFYLALSVRRSIIPTLRLHSPINSSSARKFLSLMLPVTLGAAVMTVSGFLDMALIYRRLPLCGLSKSDITSLYGAYTGMALTLYHLPQAFSGAVAVSILPAISAAWTKKQSDTCNRLISSSVRLTLMVCIPCGAVLSVFARPLLMLLFPAQAQAINAAEPLLTCLGMSEAFVGLSSVTASVLQAVGRPDLTVLSTFVGCSVKFAAAYRFMAEPSVGILAAPLSNLLCFFVIALINLILVFCIMHRFPPIFSPAFKYAAASSCMAFIGVSIYQSRLAIWGLTRSLLCACFIMVFVYIIALIPLGGWQAEDIQLLPFGKFLSQKLHLK